MIIRIKQVDYNATWYMRDYLVGRTCKVLAVEIRKTRTDRPAYKAYFVLHPISKKPGYWVVDKHCDVVEKSKVPTWNQFLSNNDYGYSKYRKPR